MILNNKKRNSLVHVGWSFNEKREFKLPKDANSVEVENKVFEK